jgi:hypothetical protein
VLAQLLCTATSLVAHAWPGVQWPPVGGPLVNLLHCASTSISGGTQPHLHMSDGLRRIIASRCACIRRVFKQTVGYAGPAVHATHVAAQHVSQGPEVQWSLYSNMSVVLHPKKASCQSCQGMGVKPLT